MKNKNLKRTIGVFLFFLLSLININKIEAKNYEEEQVGEQYTNVYNVYINKKETADNEMIICAYAKQGEEESNIITYSLDTKRLDKWSIATLAKEYKRLENTLYTWSGFRDALPPVFFESYESENDEVWNKDLKGYTQLQENFECPSRVYIENMEDPSRVLEITKIEEEMDICYENASGTCKKRNEEDNVLNSIYFTDGSPLTYSLNRELSQMLIKAEDLIYDTNESEIIKPLLNMKTGASDQNDTDKICNILISDEFKNIVKDTNANEKYSTFLNGILRDAYEKIDHVGQYNYNRGLYTYENLSNLFYGFGNLNITYDNQSLKESFEILQRTYAEKVGSSFNSYKSTCSAKTGKSINVTGEDVEKTTNEILKNMSEQSVLGGSLDCDSIFSDIAPEIKTAYFFIEILAIVLVIALSSLDYAKIIMTDNQDEMKKANKKLARRIIVLVAIFLLPAIVNIILGLFKIEGFNSSNPLCVNVTEK